MSSNFSTPYPYPDSEERKKQTLANAEQALRHFSRVFNTAVVSTRVEQPRNISLELREMMNSPAFRSILKAAQHLAAKSGVTEKEAAEQIIRTFRKLDTLWSEYLVREGVEKVRKP